MSIAAGAVTGLCSAAAVSWWMGPGDRQGVDPARSAVSPAASARSADSERAPMHPWGRDGRIAALERRISRLAEGAGGRASEANQVVSVETEPQVPDEAEEKHVVDQHLRSIERHKQDAKDPVWAPRASKALRADLHEVADVAGFQLIDVDCRATSCIGVLEWGSFSDAVLVGLPALHHPWADEVNCTHRIVLPPPEDPELPYQATMVWDCGEQGSESL